VTRPVGSDEVFFAREVEKLAQQPGHEDGEQDPSHEVRPNVHALSDTPWMKVVKGFKPRREASWSGEHPVPGVDESSHAGP
jgi:hypothetical protein